MWGRQRWALHLGFITGETYDIADNWVWQPREYMKGRVENVWKHNLWIRDDIWGLGSWVNQPTIVQIQSNLKIESRKNNVGIILGQRCFDLMTHDRQSFEFARSLAWWDIYWKDKLQLSLKSSLVGRHPKLWDIKRELTFFFFLLNVSFRNSWDYMSFITSTQ